MRPYFCCLSHLTKDRTLLWDVPGEKGQRNQPLFKWKSGQRLSMCTNTQETAWIKPEMESFAPRWLLEPVAAGQKCLENQTLCKTKCLQKPFMWTKHQVSILNKPEIAPYASGYNIWAVAVGCCLDTVSWEIDPFQEKVCSKTFHKNQTSSFYLE